jgi:hypothetical protein
MGNRSNTPEATGAASQQKPLDAHRFCCIKPHEREACGVRAETEAKRTIEREEANRVRKEKEAKAAAAKASANKGCLGCLGVIVLILVIGWLLPDTDTGNGDHWFEVSDDGKEYSYCNGDHSLGVFVDDRFEILRFRGQERNK